MLSFLKEKNENNNSWQILSQWILFMRYKMQMTIQTILLIIKFFSKLIAQVISQKY